MNGILNDEHLQHYILFSEGLWQLLQSLVTLLDISKLKYSYSTFATSLQNIIYISTYTHAYIYTINWQNFVLKIFIF